MKFTRHLWLDQLRQCTYSIKKHFVFAAALISTSDWFQLANNSSWGTNVAIKVRNNGTKKKSPENNISEMKMKKRLNNILRWVHIRCEMLIFWQTSNWSPSNNYIMEQGLGVQRWDYIDLWALPVNTCKISGLETLYCKKQPRVRLRLWYSFCYRKAFYSLRTHTIHKMKIMPATILSRLTTRCGSNLGLDCARLSSGTFALHCYQGTPCLTDL